METKDLTENYWSNRYKDQSTGWDIGYPSEPLKGYIDQLTDKNVHILIPGAGNAYEAEYLYAQGFKNVFVMDISAIPLQNFKDRNPNFPNEQLIEADFFKHTGQYDLILEQTFFCSFEPTKENRQLYGKKMAQLLNPNGKLVGVWFDIPLIEGNMDKRPFGGSKKEYLEYLTPYLTTKVFETCYNSIVPRAGQELFGIFVKKV
jgi:methyl halide transferase